MIRKSFFWLLLAATVALWTYQDELFPPERFAAATANVRDGDTLILGGKALRLDGIDAPEYRQACRTATGGEWPCGKAARSHLEALARAGPVTCESREDDRYGRAVARCSAKGADLGEAMVAAGLAIGEGAYAKSQAAARDSKSGIWQGDFEDPAAWRAAHPREETP